MQTHVGDFAPQSAQHSFIGAVDILIIVVLLLANGSQAGQFDISGEFDAVFDFDGLVHVRSHSTLF